MAKMPKVPSPAERPSEYLFLVLSFGFGIIRRYIPLPGNLEADLQMGLALALPGITWLVASRRKHDLAAVAKLTPKKREELRDLRDSP